MKQANRINRHKPKKNLIKRILNAIVSIMAPIITVLIAGGMFKVVIAILALLGLDPKAPPISP